MSITPRDPADFTPTRGNYTELKPFRFWCQKVLPLVYDDSLSYYELLCKVVDFLNKTMEDVETLEGDVTGLHTAYVELQTYVNEYFSTLDVQTEIDNKLDEMAESGALNELIDPLLPDLISAWLSEHITPTTPAIDDTLTVEGAGADAKTVGDNFALSYSTNKSYVAGEYVLYNGKLYRCVEAISTPESWNINHWQLIKINGDIDDLRRNIATDIIELKYYNKTDGKYRAYNTGIIYPNNAFCYSDYILVKPDSNYGISEHGSNSVHTTFWDVNGNYISGTTALNFTTPKNCAYIVMSYGLDAYNTIKLTLHDSYLKQTPSGCIFSNDTVFDFNDAEFNKIYNIHISNYSNLSNIPINKNGTLITIGSDYNNYAGRQYYITLDGIIYGRYYVPSNNTWSAWANKTPLSGNVYSEATTFNVNNAKWGETLVVNVGDFSNISNLPVNENGVLMCIDTPNHYAGRQVYITNQGVVYSRYYNPNNNTWSDWTGGNYMPRILTVGSGMMYYSIPNAMTYAKDDDIILVYPGVYESSVNAYSKRVHIVGVSKEECILKFNANNYNYPPLSIAKGSVSNLTILATWDGTMTQTRAYCVHIDDDNERNEELSFSNVDFISERGNTIGVGLRTNFKLKFEYCTFHTKESGYESPIYLHTAENETSYTGEYEAYENQNVVFKDCTIINETTDYSIYLQSQERKDKCCNITFIDDKIIQPDNEGKTIRMTMYNNRTLTNTNFMGSSDFVLTKISALNSQRALDYPEQN